MLNPFETEERRAFQDNVRKFMESEINPYVDEWDEAGGYPHEVNEKVCKLGVFGFDIPEEYGGLGFDDRHMRKAVGLEMGRSSAGGVMASVGSRSIMLKPLTELANEEIKSRALPDLLSGKKGGSLGITEPGGGSDVASGDSSLVAYTLTVSPEGVASSASTFLRDGQGITRDRWWSYGMLSKGAARRSRKEEARRELKMKQQY